MPASRDLVRVASVLLAVLALTAATGCGGDDDSGGAAKAAGAGADGTPVGPESAGSVVQYADCEDWRGGSPADRRETVLELRGQLTPQGSETAESPLPDERAYEILQKTCKIGYNGSLRLYKLYVRAQGFAPLTN